MVLPRAIIAVPTRQEAKLLDEFFTRCGYNVDADEKWGGYRNDTCYNWDGFTLCYCWRRWYEERDPVEYDWWPEDPNLVFISVDDYITYCEGDRQSEIVIRAADLETIL